MWIWVNTVFYTHFLKDRNCDICQRTNISRAPCRRRIGGAVLRAENFGDLITADHKVLSQSCESRNNDRFAIVVQDLATQWNYREACKISWSPTGSLKSLTLTIPWNFAKLVKIFPGIIVRRHHTDRKQMGLLREQYAEWKKVRLQYCCCCNQVWMKIGEQLLWNAKLNLRNIQDLLSVWTENTLTRHIFSHLHALISMSHVTLAQCVLRTSSMCHLHVVVLILCDPLLCALHRLSHLPFHSPVLHLPCGLVRWEVPCALPRMRSWLFGQQHPSHMLRAQHLQRLPHFRDHCSSFRSFQRWQALELAWLGNQWLHHRQSALFTTDPSGARRSSQP